MANKREPEQMRQHADSCRSKKKKKTEKIGSNLPSTSDERGEHVAVNATKTRPFKKKPQQAAGKKEQDEKTAGVLDGDVESQCSGTEEAHITAIPLASTETDGTSPETKKEPINVVLKDLFGVPVRKLVIYGRSDWKTIPAGDVYAFLEREGIQGGLYEQDESVLSNEELVRGTTYSVFDRTLIGNIREKPGRPFLVKPA